MAIKIGKHLLNVVKDPEISIDERMRIMSIVITVEDMEGREYELHYLSSMDDPDLIITNSSFAELQ